MNAICEQVGHLSLAADPNLLQSIVLSTLQKATSQDPHILKQAEAKLIEWETQPGYHTTLYSVVVNHSVDWNIRFLAVMCLKNGVEKYWRPNAPNAMRAEEKQALRNALVGYFQEPNNQIAVQIAVLVAKIARTDCPKEWPELYPTLLQAIESADLLAQHRSLLTLHYVVKAIASKRLLDGRLAFQEFTLNIYSFMLNLWNNFTEAFIRNTMQHAPVEETSSNLDKALLTVRILHKLTAFGFRKPHLHQDCMQFVKVVFDRVRTALECRRSLVTRELAQLCEKFIVHLMKILRSFLDSHRISFVDFIEPTLDFVYCYLFTTDEMRAMLFERLTIQCFNLMKTILLCSEYRLYKDADNKTETALKADAIIVSFFQPVVVLDICRKLVMHYFLLTSEELELWDADPETFVNDEGGDCWKYSLRPSMECLFTALFTRFRDNVTGILLEIIRDNSAMVSPEDMDGIRRKDAVYNAVGLAGYNLYHDIEFNDWFTSTLTQELQVNHNNYRILRRRIAILLGIWLSIKLAEELRPHLYECLSNLLNPDEDMVVRLTATTALKHSMEDFFFKTENFAPFIEPIFRNLFQLLQAANEGDTKMHVLCVLTLIAERMGESTVLVQSLVEYLPLLWQESAEHNMLRSAIVSSLVTLVKVGCVLNHDFLLHVIKLGTDPNRDALLYLLEDSLLLWEALLASVKTMHLQFVELMNNMPTLLELSTENWNVCMSIITMHLVLEPEMLMNDNGTALIMCLNSMMGDLRQEALVMLGNVLDFFVRCSPEKGSETIKPVLPKVLEFIIRNDQGSRCFSEFVMVMSRVILASHNVFNESLRELARRTNESEETLLSSLLDTWTAHCQVTRDEMKIYSLALVSLLTTRNHQVLRRMPQILALIVETLHDLSWIQEDGTVHDCCMLDQETWLESASYKESEHELRVHRLLLIDPVANIVLADCLQLQLIAVRIQLGQEEFERLMQTVDGEVISQLKGFIAF